MLPAAPSLTSLTGGGSLTPSASANSNAKGGEFSGGSGNTSFGDIVFGSKSGGLSNTTLYVAAGVVGLIALLWIARRK